MERLGDEGCGSEADVGGLTLGLDDPIFLAR